MDWIKHLTNLSMEDIENFFAQYAALGALPGIALTFFEAFIPILPLFAFIIANASAYGLLAGFIYSWIGVCAGSIVVFLIFRKMGGRLRAFVHKKMPKTDGFFHWMENQSFTPLFLLCCFPFTPSFFINAVSGLSSVSFRTFSLAIVCGKAVMIFMIAFIGYDLPSIISKPWKLGLVCLLIAALWFGGKKVEQRYRLK
jgi:uncharacterized membrane protein YdjX (TVP38/TMEM64 family)